MSKIKVLICGGRDFTDYEKCKTDVLELVKGFKKVTLVTGMAKGADSMALRLNHEYVCDLEKYPAEWDRYGRSAGYKRNAQMLEEGKPDVVLAYWDGSSKGTKNMIDISKKANINTQIKYYGEANE